MNIATLKNRPFFTAQDVAEAAGTTVPSAHVLCSRYARKGIFLRLKKNFYVLRDNWERYRTVDYLRIGNFLQVPSYVSCATALGFYGITTQVQQQWFEFIATRRTTVIEADGTTFSYHKLQQRLFFGFKREGGVFIAEPEKAVLDAAYLEVLGRYVLDWSAADLARLDAGRLKELAGAFPSRFRKRMRETCRI